MVEAIVYCFFATFASQLRVHKLGVRWVFCQSHLFADLLFPYLLPYLVLLLVSNELLFRSWLLTLLPIDRGSKAQFFIIRLRKYLKAFGFEPLLAVILPCIESLDVLHRHFLPLHPFLYIKVDRR